MSVELHINGEHMVAPPGLSLFEHAETLGVYVPTSCKKQGKCKECLVEIEEGMDCLQPRTSYEDSIQGNFRLSCRARIVAETGTIRCHTMRRGTMRIEHQASHLPVSMDTLEIDPCVTRDGDRVLLDGEEIEKNAGDIHGVAIDLGTTTVVLRVYNLESGTLVAESSFENPQRFGGSDVMSRIQFDTEHGGRLLQRTLAGYVKHALEELPVDPKTIYEMVVVGNSTMRDLFFRLNVYSIGQNPYQSITELEMQEGKRSSTSVVALARQLSLPLHPNARIYGVPVISGHVGADAAACLLAIDLVNESRMVALMDVGTNTELILGTKDRIFAASCPAGPAFEGGRISHGMPALPGAIEKVVMNPDGSFECLTIGGVPATGICGSGLVDLLSELRRNELISTMGRFVNGAREVVLPADTDRRVAFTEGDINELAQAKGANVAGLQIICSQYGIRFDDIDVFYLAGGFGHHLNVASSKRIGLIPDIDTAKIRQIGNAAIEGASIALLSQSKRRELEGMVRRVVHCRLESHPDFFDYFVEGCQFTPVVSLSCDESDAGGRG